jgi:hypothetical protein
MEMAEKYEALRRKQQADAAALADSDSNGRVEQTD